MPLKSGGRSNACTLMQMPPQLGGRSHTCTENIRRLLHVGVRLLLAGLHIAVDNQGDNSYHKGAAADPRPHQ
ncbi:hypothetical protein MAR_011223 [Mya arenaria]|uniref:Uncharacterized protein n=1 Tax=Mya arenaria TaxID=6604 RepID=A0ABY7FX98_MYAAR|nr:hypothetical protein MAR_011223 [Mya arenaria]